ncbi:MAG: hypothetical protein JWR19_4347 [Pedosphaera sp.]|nr:hypothetical protein [Pedosphaera sp.]
MARDRWRLKSCMAWLIRRLRNSQQRTMALVGSDNCRGSAPELCVDGFDILNVYEHKLRQGHFRAKMAIFEGCHSSER